MDWRLQERGYRDVKFMHGWNLIPNQNKGELIMEFKKFLTKECIKG